jgi:hypothetical protein
MLLETQALTEGIARGELAMTVEPRNRVLLEPAIVRACALRGEWAEVEAALQRQLESGGDRLSYWLARTRLALWKNDPREKRRVKSELASARFPHKTFAMLYAGCLGTEPPDLLQRQFIDDRTQSPTCSRRQRAYFSQLAAEGYASQGDMARGLDALEAAVEHGLFDAAWIDLCPALASLREHPRFRILRDEVNHRAVVIEQTLLGC